MLGELIGAGASLLGGMFGSNAAKDQAKQQAKLQKEFAKNGIQWKVEDAKKAGIAPLYALGANTTSYSPVSVGDTNPLQGLANAGQDIGRAVNATRSTTDKAGALQLTTIQLQNEGLGLDNEIKRATLASKIATQNPNGVTPGMPSDLREPFIAGQGNGSDPFKVQNQREAAQAGLPESAAGLNPEVNWYRSKTGYAPQIPQQLGEAIEGEPMELSGLQWFLRNKVAPIGGGAYFNPPFKAPPGKEWSFNPVMGQYELTSKSSGNRMWVPSWMNDGRG